MQGVKKAGLLMILALSALLVHAQDEQAPPQELLDTIIPVEEDAPSVVIDAPVTDYQSNTYQSETRTDYFSKRWDEYGNPDSITIHMRGIPDSAVAALHADDDFWYANNVFAKKKEQDVNDVKPNPVYQGLLWFLIIGGFITFLVIYLANSNVGLLRRTKKLHSEEEYTEEMDNIFAINYQKEIDKAISAGNYRLAVRLLFLKLLRQLSDKNVIQYKQDRTNFDYLMQLSNTSWYKPFFRIARNYEYVWYGKFDINENQFASIKNEFTNLEGQL